MNFDHTLMKAKGTKMIKITLSTKNLIINRYLHLLAIILLTFLCFPLLSVWETHVGLPILSLIFVITILSAMRAIIENSKRYHFYVILALAGLCVDWIGGFLFREHLISRTIVSSFVLCLFIFFLVVAIFEMLKHLFFCRTVTLDSILGGISIYFLLGYLWTCFFLLIGIFNKEAFETITKTQMLYFSFSTITTLGYGDIVPNSGLAKMLANLEAITGQMYTTIFIARLVGLQIVSEVSKKE
jgi:hypothetical protein